MSAQFDTSGEIPGPPYRPGDAHPGLYRFSNLSPFVQGYVEALLRSAWDDTSFRSKWLLRDVLAEKPESEWRSSPPGFSDLAPETLARIMEDCAELQEAEPHDVWTADDGEAFWRQRNTREHRGFSPLTPYLGDDSKVYLREGQS